MGDTIRFRAPTGAEIIGTNEKLTGTANCYFTGPDPSADIGYQDGTDVAWDDQETETIEGAPVFVDDNGEHWLSHHLIPPSADPLSDELVRTMKRELQAGRAVQLTEQRNALLNSATGNVAADPWLASMQAIYATIRATVTVKRERELAA